MANNARVLWGTVDPDGSIVSGMGYKVDKGGKGLYTVIFDESYSFVPGVSTTQIYYNNGNGGDTRDNSALVFVKNDRFRVKTGNDNGDASDRGFSFVVAGV
ncbi:hypothetical protein SAMN04487970_102371 [Paenibacillus tianmuensis]|uniref:Uncharacterized protein n=1 Tax=Paenibacillus tianmuensis TaxID=624147 RepID=A0A1G4S6I3_9BACL|nr:hypothetical protein [Paenibacillus tianmuensis]SCW64648.1 hypothetical protein SAMN04487970_102371 [Paenibacillus tianmuensis]